MSFVLSKTGYVMYQPSWQKEPGARMKQMNRDASDSYYANFSTLGNNLLAASNDQTLGMIEITSKIVTTRLQNEYSKKLEQAKAGLDVIL